MTVLAQGQNNDNNPLGTKEIDISRTIFIQEAKKLGVPIQIEKITVKEPEYTYDIVPVLFVLNPYHRERIQPITLGDVKMPDIKKKYLDLSMGNYRNLWGDFFYGSKRNRGTRVDLSLSHRSGKAPANWSNFGLTSAQFGLDKLYPNHQLKLRTTVSHQRVHHYGYRPLTPSSEAVDPKDFRSDYFLATALGNFNNSLSRKQKHLFSSHFQPYYWASRAGETEWAAMAGGSLREPLKMGELAFDLEYDYNAYHSLTGTWNRNIVRVGAKYLLTKDQLNIQAGFKTAADNTWPPGDSASSVNNLYIFPDILVRYSLANGKHLPYLGIHGGLHKNSMRSLSHNNPFIGSNLQLKNTIERIRLEGGMKGSITRELGYHAWVRYANLNQMLLYANVDSALNYFTPLYTGTNSTMFTASAQLNYKQLERLEIDLQGNYYQYVLVNRPALHLPSYDIRLNAKYNLQNKILAHVQAVAIGQRQGGTALGDSMYVLPALIDLCLGGAYQFNEKMSLYLNINNVLNKKYMLWNGFPVQGLHIQIGGKFVF